MSGFLTYIVCEEVMHSDFTPFGAYWLNYIPLDTILLYAEAFHTSARGHWRCEGVPIFALVCEK